MAGGIFYLLSIGTVMFFGSYAAGSLPLVMNISETRLKQVAAFGAGILVATALGVIIPEGFAALSEASEGAHAHVASAGAALIAGFLIMLLLDNCQHSWPYQAKQQISCKDLSASESSEELHRGGDSAQRALIGLVIHSAADGFAMGTATTSDNTTLTAMVGLAMVLHRAPVAFGLATYLMTAKWTWQRSQQGVLLFSATSPLVAVLTYAILRHIPRLSTPFAVALCVIFSGGTFLYAACLHILPGIKGSSPTFTNGQVFSIFVGTLLPLMFASHHSHGSASNSSPPNMHQHPHP